MKLDSLIVDMESNLANFNAVKDIVLERLLDDNVITSEQAAEYGEKWNVIIVKPSWFKRYKDKFFKNDDDNIYIFKYVKFED